MPVKDSLVDGPERDSAKPPVRGVEILFTLKAAPFPSAKPGETVCALLSRA